MLNCFRDRELLWKQKVQPHPICFMCEVNFKSWKHLFGECPDLKEYLEKLNLNSVKEVFNEVNIAKVKATVTITLGSVNEAKFQTFSNLQKLTDGL